jgi:hypothetical protein
MKKALMLVLLFALFPALVFAGGRMKNISRCDINAQLLVDATTLANGPGGISTTATSCILGTAAGCSITCLVVPASTSAAFVTNFKVPNNYAGNGKFYLVAKSESAADTTCRIRMDVQTQELNSLTSTAVTVGTASTAVAAANGSQWQEIALPNDCSLSPGTLCNLYFARSAGTTSALDILEVAFWYKPLAGISR